MTPNPPAARPDEPGPPRDPARDPARDPGSPGLFQRRGDPEELPAPDELAVHEEADGSEGEGSIPTSGESDPRTIGRTEGRGIGEAGGEPGEVGGEPPIPPPTKPATERQLDQAVAESFPASDPTSTQREPPGAGDAPPDLRHRLPPEGV